MRYVITALVLGLPLLAGCQGEPAKPSAPPVEDKPDPNGYKLIKLVVMANGDITANGQPMSLGQLELRLPKVRAAGGTVWYYRENPDDEGHPNAMKVVQLVAKNQLPIKRSEQSDFSDIVDDKGKSEPSKK